jgi:hypothetical protein
MRRERVEGKIGLGETKIKCQDTATDKENEKKGERKKTRDKKQIKYTRHVQDLNLRDRSHEMA